MAVITISRQFGCGGDEIADRVCEILGYHHFDRREIARAAVEAGFSEREIAGDSESSEQNYKYKKFVDHLLRRARPSFTAKPHHSEEISVREIVSEEQLLDDASSLGIIQKAIKAAYHANNFLIVGRGSQMVLKDYPGVLSIRLEASLEMRIERARQYLKEERQSFYPPLENRRTAQELIAERDAASAAYVRHFYGVDWADPSLYHIVMNTSKFTIEKAAGMIVQMVRFLEGPDGDGSYD
jgi:CMP/dCMP kinase